MRRPFIIAEACCNHGGQMGAARLMIRAAARAGAHYIKFQKRDNRVLLSPEQYDAPHPVPENAYGDTYGEHRDALEFSIEEHRQLKAWCAEEGIGYACSVFDLPSAHLIAGLQPDYIKVPSLANLNLLMLEYLLGSYDGGVHISTGMTTDEELAKIVQLVRRFNALDRVVWYACTSGYPTPYEAVHLPRVEEIARHFGRAHTGFSGHHMGIAVDAAAVALGADWIERHFTLDKRAKGTDNALSLESHELETLVRDTRHVQAAMAPRPSGVLDVEAGTRSRLKTPAQWPA